MKSVLERYSDYVVELLNDEHPTCIIYGSSTTGICTSDIDACIITEHELSSKRKQFVIESLVAFMKEEGLSIDDEVPFENKILFSKAEVEYLSSHSPFEMEDGSYCIEKIKKTPQYLGSSHMRHRLWCNIVTTDHLVTCGDYAFVEACSECTWIKMLDVLLELNPTFRDATPEIFLELLYRNPHTYEEGEFYLGYKNNNPRKQIYLLNCLYKYLPAVQCKQVNAEQNCNPFFPTPAMVTDLQKSIFDLLSYPEFNNLMLQQEAGRIFSVPVENVLFTNGAMEAIQIIIQGCEDWGIPTPTFWGYSAAARISGKHYIEYPVETGRWKTQLKHICNRHQGVFLCYPNNPLPQDLEKNDFLELISENPDCHFVVDESMLPFRKEYRSQTLIPDVCNYNNLTVILSLSKISGMCGMRGGLLFTGKKMIDEIGSRARKYTTSTMTQRFFTKYLNQILDCDDIRKEIRDAFCLLIGKLKNCPGIRRIIDAEVAFILIEFEEDIDVEGLVEYLLKKRIKIMYPYDSYPEMDPSIIRISACSKPDARKIADSILLYCCSEVVD